MKTTFLRWPCLCLALLFVTMSACEQTQMQRVEKPEKTIDKEQAAKLSSRFVNELTELMEGTKDTAGLKRTQKVGFVPTDRVNFKLASYTYYTVEELEHYFAWVKQEAKEKGYELEGFRLHFGIYPDDEDLGEKRNFMTMFISPAGKKVDKQQGAVINMPFMYQDNPETITEIDSYNFGGQGQPPSEMYDE